MEKEINRFVLITGPTHLEHHRDILFCHQNNIYGLFVELLAGKTFLCFCLICIVLLVMILRMLI